MAWTLATSWYLPTRGSGVDASDGNKLKFSQIRSMYDQSTGGKSLKNYYRNGTIVTSDTYFASIPEVDSGGNTIDKIIDDTNQARLIPTSGQLRMSKFRGSAKNHILNLSSQTSTIQGSSRNLSNLLEDDLVDNANSTNKRIYHVNIDEEVYSIHNGKKGLVVNNFNGHHRVYIWITGDGSINASSASAIGNAGHGGGQVSGGTGNKSCLLYTSPSPRD